ncbi:Taurine dioxygenase, alpha-ketoglutarate-dependent [Sphingomonas sp. YR710]|uniref:TauD/TfdA family dioxygenase n=1 Tax=Sphingomonas sp. YR710 TaxID=1882773 RepID=UPI0008871D15|nr:TauD/TfdA family dioxygenase [Sphingomonas sp. YR710]SDC46980.1 Taurine dioxygenase, alpha-ketoglutarate-dependent [Sphingomonas sp. YR710]
MARLTLPGDGRPYALLEADNEASLLDLATDTIETLFRQHGALLFRGFPPDLAAFRQFTTRFCTGSVFNESPDRQLLDDAHNIQSVNGGADPFPLHPELSREPWKPDVCFFHCLKAPRSGGETTICDGVALVDALPDEVRRELSAHRLLYLQPIQPWHFRYWLGTDSPSDAEIANPPASCPYRFGMAGGYLVRAFTRPALHRPMFTDRPAFGNFLLFARDYNGRHDFPLLEDGRQVPDAWVEAIRVAARPITTPVVWQPGDLLMLDNSRFLHGRNAIADPTDRLIASFFGYLRFAPVNPEEPESPLWRRNTTFRPPQPLR